MWACVERASSSSFPVLIVETRPCMTEANRDLVVCETGANYNDEVGVTEPKCHDT